MTHLADLAVFSILPEKCTMAKLVMHFCLNVKGTSTKPCLTPSLRRVTLGVSFGSTGSIGQPPKHRINETEIQKKS